MKPSVLGNISNFTIGNAITIPITKYNSSYSDTLNIYVGTTWIKRVEGLVNNQSISFTASEINTIYNAMPNVTAASFRFVNTTYNRASIVGTSEKQATGSINTNIKPTISDVSLSEAISAITTKFGGYVQYQSRINVDIEAEAGYGSTIDFYSGNVGTYYIMDNPITTNVLTKSGTNNWSATVTDKRGRTATSSGTFEVLEYDSPKITSFSVVRCNSEGAEDLYGNYVKVNATASISSVNSRNDKIFKVQYKLTSATAWTDLITYSSGYTHTVTNSVHSGFSEDNTYDFRYIATDFFTTAESDLSLSAGFAIIDLRANGRGVGLGTLSTKNALQVGYEIFDRFDTKINNGLAHYEAGGAADVNTTLEELVLSANNTPDTGFWYVRTMFYGTKSTTTNRVQTATPYNRTNTPTYYRVYFNTGWSDWTATDIKEVSFEDGSGYIWFGNGLLVQWGRISITPSAANVVTPATIYFQKSYDYQPKVEAIPNVSVPSLVSVAIGGGTTVNFSKEAMIIYMTRTNTASTTFQWSAIGMKGV